MSKLPPTTPLERYLDGQLSESDRQRVERALAANPGAQEQVRLQRRLDDSMSRLFGAGPAAPLAIPQRRRIPLWPLAAAASLLIVLAGVWAVFFRTPGRPATSSVLVAVYHAQVDGGFIPKDVCTTREQFGEWVATYYQQPLYPPAAHDGIEFVGWNYAKAVSSSSGVLLARVQGKEVIVVIDRAVRERQPFSCSGLDHLHVYRAQIGTVVLYEVSPLDQASILPILSTSH